jgi:hypothetical protein
VGNHGETTVCWSSGLDKGLPSGNVSYGDGLTVHVQEAVPDLVHGVEAVRDVEEDEVAVLHELVMSALVLNTHSSFNTLFPINKAHIHDRSHGKLDNPKRYGYEGYAYIYWKIGHPPQGEVGYQVISPRGKRKKKEKWRNMKGRK